MQWFAILSKVPNTEKEVFCGRVYAADEAEAAKKWQAVYPPPKYPARFQLDPKWEIR